MTPFESITAVNLREPNLITVARRFCRRARQHGVAINESPIFRPTHVIVRFADRSIRIDADGGCLPMSAYQDPGGRSNYARMHARNLDLAGRFRRRGQRLIALAALDNCCRDRAECAPLPA